jgi:predicted nucleic acid-binding Zn ribbon protein
VPDQNPDDKLRLAREALASALADARARGVRPVPPPASAGADGTGALGNDQPPDGVIRRSDLVSGSGRRSAARPGFPVQQGHDEPQPLARAIDGLLTAEGWTVAAATGSVFGRWAQIVGADLAAHTRPESLTDGELTVSADSTAWATQVRLLAAQLVRRLSTELGDGTVVRVKVRGPVTSIRRPGEWRVRGSRGPRDTYG